MEKDRTYRTVSVIALIVAVVALSIGYAAFTASLNITASATVKPENTFTDYIKYQETSAVYDEDSSNVLEADVTGISAGEFDTDLKSWGDIKAVLTKPGDKEVFKATVENSSPDFIGYLNYAAWDSSENIINVEINDTDIAAWIAEDSVTRADGSDYVTEEYLGALKQNFKVTVYANSITEANKILDSSSASSPVENVEIAKNNGTVNGTVDIYVVVEYLSGTDTQAIDLPVSIEISDLELTWSTYSKYLQPGD